MSGRLQTAFRSGRFAVTAELGLPHGADAQAVTAKADLVRDHVDAVNLTDNPSANVMLSAVAGSVLAMRAGVEPVMQLTCRDRNRIALQSELIGAAALGIPNVLLLSGDHPRYGNHPDAKPVFDIDSIQLTWLARTLRDEGRLLSGAPVTPAPSWTIGVVENPFAPPREFRAARLAKKADAGAEFVQTQFVFDLPAFERFLNRANDLGVTERCRILAGVGPIRSLRALEFLRSQVPGVHVPDDVVRRLRSVPPARVAEVGVAICVETLQALAELDGVAGVHVMAFGFERRIGELLERSGIAALRASQSDIFAGAHPGARPSTVGIADRLPAGADHVA